MSRSKEEAIAAGVQVRETRHKMKRRKPWHDYHRKGTYMVTLVVEGRRPVLGKLIMSAGEQDTSVELTALGKAIRNEEVQKISAIYKMVEVWKLCIMPDHIHMIVRIKEDLPEGKHLGHIVAGFKGGCSRAWWKMGFRPYISLLENHSTHVPMDVSYKSALGNITWNAELSHASNV